MLREEEEVVKAEGSLQPWLQGIGGGGEGPHDAAAVSTPCGQVSTDSSSSIDLEVRAPRVA